MTNENLIDSLRVIARSRGRTIQQGDILAVEDALIQLRHLEQINTTLQATCRGYEERVMQLQREISLYESGFMRAENENQPIGWMTLESVSRLRIGGNGSKGTVPVHAKRINTTCIPIYGEALCAMALRSVPKVETVTNETEKKDTVP